jgi:hypothetical protein
LQFSASVSRPSLACKSLPAMLNDRERQYIKATFRQFLWRVILLWFTFINSTVVLGQNNLQIDNSNFDKQKWLTSSDYRYEIMKGKDFPAVEYMTQKQIIRLLGRPDFKTKSELTYCLDLWKEKEKKKNICKCSLVTIYLDKKLPPQFRVVILWAEPGIKKTESKTE